MAVELFEDNGSESGMSLNDLVRRSEARFSDETARLFRDRLLAGGYVERKEYDLPLFETGRVRCYDVRDGFPAITRADVPQGVTRVRYILDLNVAQTFLVPKIPIWGSGT
ncbi:hypothetical protein ABI_38950 [Asticcacaulis biprosthecium C19]|uniref:Uncharacterized protein n=1 Tax=Asticcacaulis biprosthecium C19 TaxID=715226 RepID=F4QRW1_9CAUL|nr:hypothetical protein ABI_38950 [Asticcacaulis biprosthecium C19]